jgi:hypothetical protein
MEEERPADDDGRDKAVKQKRAGEVNAEPVAIDEFIAAELEVCGDDSSLRVSAAG